MIQFGAGFSTLGVPETGLSPTIIIRDTSDGSVVINGVGMTEVGGGAYKYDFDNDTAKKYSIVIDGGVDTLDSRYMTAWSERAKAEAETALIKEVNQSLNGAKVVVDRAASTFKVYDTDGTTLMFTITKATVGNVDTLTRT